MPAFTNGFSFVGYGGIVLLSSFSVAAVTIVLLLPLLRLLVLGMLLGFCTGLSFDPAVSDVDCFFKGVDQELLPQLLLVAAGFVLSFATGATVEHVELLLLDDSAGVDPYGVFGEIFSIDALEVS